MRALNGLSRRDMMRLLGAAGLAMTGGATSAFAQAAGRIESTAPELANIINTSEPIRQLATGFGGDIGPSKPPDHEPTFSYELQDRPSCSRTT